MGKTYPTARIPLSLNNVSDCDNIFSGLPRYDTNVSVRTSPLLEPFDGRPRHGRLPEDAMLGSVVREQGTATASQLGS